MDELLKEMKKDYDKLIKEGQLLYAEKVLEMVKNYCEKANKKDYDPSNEEREVFGEIVKIVNNMKEWF